MRSRTVCNTPSLMGLAIGVAAGLAAGLLAAPMRGTEMRAQVRGRAAEGGARLQSLASSGRGWAEQALERAMMLLEEGRRAFDTSTRQQRQVNPVQPGTLTASLGEIAQFHAGGDPVSLEGRV